MIFLPYYLVSSCKISGEIMKKNFLKALLAVIIAGSTYCLTDKGYPVDPLALFLLVIVSLWVVDAF